MLLTSTHITVPCCCLLFLTIGSRSLWSKEMFRKKARPAWADSFHGPISTFPWDSSFAHGRKVGTVNEDKMVITFCAGCCWVIVGDAELGKQCWLCLSMVQMHLKRRPGYCVEQRHRCYWLLVGQTGGDSFCKDERTASKTTALLGCGKSRQLRQAVSAILCGGPVCCSHYHRWVLAWCEIFVPHGNLLMRTVFMTLLDRV